MESSAHPLEGAWTKLKWAKVNTDALQNEVAAFFGDESDPDSPRGHLESESRRAFPEKRFSPAWHWPALVGDIVHAFRSSLDYVAWELAGLNLRRQGKTRKPSRSTQFPIVRNPARWPEVEAARLSDIGQGERAMIELFQPYHVQDKMPVEEHP